MKKKHWIILIVLIILFLYRKKLIKMLADEISDANEPVSASVNTPLANLTSDLKKKGKSVSEIVMQMADKIINTKQEVYEHDLVDDQPTAQNSVSPGQFIETIYPMSDKIFANTRPRSGMRVKADQGWWPYVMYKTTPVHERVPVL